MKNIEKNAYLKKYEYMTPFKFFLLDRGLENLIYLCYVELLGNTLLLHISNILYCINIYDVTSFSHAWEEPGYSALIIYFTTFPFNHM